MADVNPRADWELPDEPYDEVGRAWILFNHPELAPEEERLPTAEELAYLATAPRWRRELQERTIVDMLFKGLFRPRDKLAETLAWSVESQHADLYCEKCFGSGKVLVKKNIIECTCVDPSLPANRPEDHIRFTGDFTTRAFFALVASNGDLSQVQRAQVL